MTVVVTITQPAVTVTATASNSTNASLSAGSIAGIVVGSLTGLVLSLALVFYLFRRQRRHTFARVANPAHHPVTPDLPRIRSRTSKHFTQNPDLVSPVSWPAIPPTSRVLSMDTSRSDSMSPRSVDGAMTPPVHIPEETPPPSPKLQQAFFVHRMLQSRARASEGVSLVHYSSLDGAQNPSPTRTSANEEQLLADAERTALCDAEAVQREQVPEEEVASSESIYSQTSAPFDDLSQPLSRQNSALSILRRKSSQRQVQLTPVAEVPVIEEQSHSYSASIAANSSLDGQISHGTASRPMSTVVDQSGMLPLLTSANFGKESATTGSQSSTKGRGSSSSGRTSRYPSLAPSSIGQSSRSDGGTDWRHLPPGLSGLKTLQIGSLRNPYSPVEEQPDERAHLREGTVSSMPEVERRTVMQGGIAHIDVAF